MKDLTKALAPSLISMTAMMLSPCISYGLGSHQTSNVSPGPSVGNVFNVKTYGATGNGTTDDTAAVQAAISAAGGMTNSVVYFPTGTYLFSNNLQAGAVSFTGQKGGSTLLSANGSNVTIKGSTSGLGIAVNDLSFQSKVTGAGPFLNMQAGNALITDNTFGPTYSTALSCSSAANVHVKSNTFDLGQNTSASAVNAVNCSNLIVQLNTISAVHATQSTPISLTTCSSAQVIKNTVYGNSADHSASSIGVYDSNSSSNIQGNYITDFVYGISINQGNPKVNLNTVLNSYQDGIFTNGASPEVSGNNIVQVSQGNGIEVAQNTQSISVLKNTISSVGSSGIYLNTQQTQNATVNISANSISNAALATATTAVIFSNEPVATITISHNRYIGNQQNLQYFVYSGQISTVSGNKTNTTLPSYP